MKSNLLQNYKRDLALKGFSLKTEAAYYQNLVRFFNYSQIEPDNVTSEIIKDYLFYLIRDKKLSHSTVNQARASICYFYSQTLPIEIKLENIPRVKKTNKLPLFFSIDEVFRIINSADIIKHKTMIMLAYSSGLRIGELVTLKPTDIRRDIMRLTVRQAKGQKDRYTLLSSVCLKQLEKYWKIYRPHDWLFYGKNKNTHISTRAVQLAFASIKQKAGILRQGSVHSLRHSFATHMLEAGCGIFQLQKLLGHRNIKSTLIYAHIKEENITARSPLDIHRNKLLNE